QGRDFFAFASEIKALLEHRDVPREVDQAALDLYRPLRYVPGARSLFKRNFKLQPGHTLLLDSSGVKVRKYCDIEYPQPEPRPFESYLQRFEQLFEQRVRLSLIAEVLLGVFLSGGLDATSIVDAMSRRAGVGGVMSF